MKTTNSTRIKIDAFGSYASPNSSTRIKKTPKSKQSRVISGNLSPKDSTDHILGQILSGTMENKEKMQKTKNESEKQMKHMLQKLMAENASLKSKLNYFNENQEEPKSTMNAYTVDAAVEEIKQKLRNLKKKFS